MGERRDDFVGASTIAERLGVAGRYTIHVWRRRDPTFPEPVTVGLQQALLWRWSDVEAWARRTGRLRD